MRLSKEIPTFRRCPNYVGSDLTARKSQVGGYKLHGKGLRFRCLPEASNLKLH